MTKHVKKLLTHRGIIRALIRAGFKAYIVGGSIRNQFLGMKVKDYDLATNATPEQVMHVFKNKARVEAVGAKFLVVLVNGYEVATFRGEVYHDHLKNGKPEVAPVSSAYSDSKRRDFTINSMFQTKRGKIIDYHGALKDIKKRLIKAVGNPLDRFNEDASRILRAISFAAILNCEIEKETKETIIRNPHLVKLVPQELIGKIVTKVMDANKLHKFISLLAETNLLQYVFPEIAHTIGIEQNPKYHDKNVFEHIVTVVQATEERFPKNIILQLSAVYHDCMKGTEGIRGINKEGQTNDLGHEEAGAMPAEQAVIRMQYGSKVASMVKFVVQFHGLRLPHDVKEGSVVKAIRKMAPYFKTKTELAEAIERLFDFMLCDADGFTPSFSQEMIVEAKLLRKRFTEALDKHVFYRQELPINGSDLIKLGFQGTKIGEILEQLVNLNIKELDKATSYLERKYVVSNQQ